MRRRGFVLAFSALLLVAACAPQGPPVGAGSTPTASAPASPGGATSPRASEPATPEPTPAPTASPTPTPPPQPARLLINSTLTYAGASGSIAADMCPNTRAAGISDKQRVLFILVGIGGTGLPTTPPDETCAAFAADSWQSAARNLGFDLYVVNYADSGTYTQRQAFAVVELIQRLQDEGTVTAEADVAMVGMSWGGLIGRYALQYMETHGPPHHVDLWITADSPLQGAYVPIGIQHVAQYFGEDLGVRSAATAKAEMLDTPSARQMLIYHYSRSGQSGPTWTPEFTALYQTELTDALGGFPKANGLRRVGISDGRADGRGDAPGAGAQILGWSSPTVDLVGSGDPIPFEYSVISGSVSPVGSRWVTYVKVTAPYINTTLWQKTYDWPVSARMDVRVFALAGRSPSRVFEARPIFTLNGTRVDLLDWRSVANLIVPLVRNEVPGIVRGLWDTYSPPLMEWLSKSIADGAKAKIAEYPWMNVRDIDVSSAYSHDGGAGGRSDKSGVVADLMTAAGVGRVTGTPIRSHAFIPVHSALMLSNTLGMPVDPVSVAVGLGQAPQTPFDHIVFATSNLGHLDATRSLLGPTVTLELADLVRRD